MTEQITSTNRDDNGSRDSTRKLASLPRRWLAPRRVHRACPMSQLIRSLPRRPLLGHRGHFLVIETPDAARDLVQRILHGEVSRVEPVHLRFRQVAQVRFAAFPREENIVLSPKDQCFRLTAPAGTSAIADTESTFVR